MAAQPMTTGSEIRYRGAGYLINFAAFCSHYGGSGGLASARTAAGQFSVSETADSHNYGGSFATGRRIGPMGKTDLATTLCAQTRSTLMGVNFMKIFSSEGCFRQ
jgi:hypothetical protein